MQIKVLSPGAKTCAALAGTGAPGIADGGIQQAMFSEPGGLCLDPQGKLLVVADTNNHLIRVVDLEKEAVTMVSNRGGTMGAVTPVREKEAVTMVRREVGQWLQSAASMVRREVEQ